MDKRGGKVKKRAGRREEGWVRKKEGERCRSGQRKMRLGSLTGLRGDEKKIKKEERSSLADGGLTGKRD